MLASTHRLGGLCDRPVPLSWGHIDHCGSCCRNCCRPRACAQTWHGMDETGRTCQAAARSAWSLDPCCTRMHAPEDGGGIEEDEVVSEKRGGGGTDVLGSFPLSSCMGAANPEEPGPSSASPGGIAMRRKSE